MWTKDNIPSQQGKIAIVTGANTGVGFETALALYEAGAHVVLACRNENKAREAKQRMEEKGGKGSLKVMVLDLTSLAAVKQFADTFLETHQQLHLLINNAGVMTPPASKTMEGFELQFGVNFIAHFALTGRLFPLLNATPGARIVNVSSLAYLHGEINFDNLRSEQSYNTFREYAQSKLANILFALELQRRSFVTSIAVHPGATATDLSRFMTQQEYDAAIDRIGALMQPWQGALSSLYAAVSPDARGGHFYGPDGETGYRGYPTEIALIPRGVDEVAAKRLWELAEEVTGVRYPA